MIREREVKQGEFYKHFKNKIYQITAIATHSETREKMVVYQALYGDFQTYVRPYQMFVSEVDHVKYPDVKQKYRFVKFDVNNGRIMDEDINKVDSNMVFQDSMHKNEEYKISAELMNQDILIPEEGQISSLLLEFLDCNNYEEKLDKFVMMKNKVDDRLLNDIAMSMDIIVESKDIKDKYEEIKSCLLTFVHFEDNRMR